MGKIERELRKAFPDHTIVKAKRGHFKIYDDHGCLVCVPPGTPGEHHWLINAQQQIRRHICPALAPAI
jgi:hypothetical protein